MRLLVTSLHHDDLGGRLAVLMDRLGRAIPRGAGPGGLWEVGQDRLESVLRGGAHYAVSQGHGRPEDLARCEDAGVVGGVDTAHVTERARQRGARQVGSLGSGNHFLEVQVVDQILDPDHADAFGLAPGMVVVMIHTGSRGLGHQVCSDHVDVMTAAMPSYGIEVPDRQLVCAPVRSPHGAAYMGAMAASANFGRANRQLLTEAARIEFEAVFGGISVDLLWDVSHNLAKIETHVIDGEERELCVHRKGATLALPPGHPDLPDDLRPWGQPALIPGSMGTASYVLAGVEGGMAFHSTCHGAGRRMSRHAARRKIHGGELRDQLEAEGIAVRGAGMRGLAEEAPFAYKDVDEVVDVCEQAGLARRVARMRPIGVVKG